MKKHFIRQHTIRLLEAVEKKVVKAKNYLQRKTPLDNVPQEQQKKLRALVVDNKILHRMVVNRVAQVSGYTTTTFENANDALVELFEARNKGDTYDLLITDFNSKFSVVFLDSALKARGKKAWNGRTGNDIHKLMKKLWPDGGNEIKSGMTLVEIARTEKLADKIIMISSVEIPENVIGMCDIFIEKPADNRVLFEVLERFTGRKNGEGNKKDFVSAKGVLEKGLDPDAD